MGVLIVAGSKIADIKMATKAKIERIQVDHALDLPLIAKTRGQLDLASWNTANIKPKAAIASPSVN